MEVQNRKAHYNYYVLDTLEVGISLLGSEIKSIRQGHVSLDEAYAIVRNGELFLLNAYVKEYVQANINNHDTRRKRKLLAHKKEIIKLGQELEKEGLTLIPLKLYLVKAKAKILLGVCKGKKDYNKKEVEKEKSIKREIEKHKNR